MRNRLDQSFVTSRTLKYFTSESHEESSYTAISRGRQDKVETLLHSGFRHPTNYNAFKGEVFSYPFSYSPAVNEQMQNAWSYHGTSCPISPQLGVRYGMSSNSWDDPRPLIAYSHREKTRAECVEKLRNSDVNIGTAIVEGREVVSLLAQTTVSTLRAFKSIKRGNVISAIDSLIWYFKNRSDLFRKIGKVDPTLIATHMGKYKGSEATRLYNLDVKRLNQTRKDILNGNHPLSSLDKTAADAWLQLSFGWKPLISDAEGLYTLLQRYWKKSVPLLSVKRRVKRRGTLPSGGPYRYTSTGLHEMLVENKYFYRIGDKTMYDLNSLDLINPLAVAWELVPFSFVLDWFIPIGTTLRNLTGTVGVDFHSGYEMSRSTVDMVVSFRRIEWDPIVGIPETYAVVNQCFERTRLFAAPATGIYVDLGFTTHKGAHTLALLRQFHR